MKKFILVLVAVIIAATEISSATEISRECKSREYTYITKEYSSKEKLIVGITETVLRDLRGLCCVDTSYLVKDLSSNCTYNYKVKALDKDIQDRYEDSREFIITVSEDKSSYLVYVNIEYSSPSFYYKTDGVLKADVPVTLIIVELPIGADPNSRELTITRSEDKSYYLFHVDEIIENSSIFVYNIDGNFVSFTHVTSNTGKLPLFKGGTYVVNYSFNDEMKLKDRIRKPWGFELYLRYKYFSPFLRKI